MKKSDMALLLIIVSISALVAYFGANLVMGDPEERSEKVYTMEAISSDVSAPDKNIFYNGAINPSVKVEIDSDSESAENNSQPAGNLPESDNTEEVVE